MSYSSLFFFLVYLSDSISTIETSVSAMSEREMLSLIQNFQNKNQNNNTSKYLLSVYYMLGMPLRISKIFSK